MAHLQSKDGHLLSKDGHLLTDCNCCGCWTCVETDLLSTYTLTCLMSHAGRCTNVPLSFTLHVETSPEPRACVRVTDSTNLDCGGSVFSEAFVLQWIKDPPGSGARCGWYLSEGPFTFVKKSGGGSGDLDPIGTYPDMPDNGSGYFFTDLEVT
jgi:hypothetical protein